MNPRQILILFIGARRVQAQRAPSEEFDAASVRPATVPPGSHGIMGPHTGSFTGENMPLKQYIAWA
jgi:hypothetical protein